MIVVTGDMHGDINRFKDPKIRRLKKDDYLIICGDFGFIWDGSKAEQAMLKKIGKMRFATLFIDGTHENFEMLSEYPTLEMFGNKVRHISGKLYYLMRGGVYNIDNQKVFALGGGESSDFDMREEGKTWWRCELPTMEELENAESELKKAEMNVDYIITHDAPGMDKGFINMDDHYRNHLHAFLDRIARECRYKQWLFGCYHIDKRISHSHIAVFKNTIKL